MDVFNYRNMADTYQASVNSLQNINPSRATGWADNVVPPRTVNTHDTAAMTNLAAAVNDPNIVYQNKTSAIMNDLAQNWLRKTENNINGLGNILNVSA